MLFVVLVERIVGVLFECLDFVIDILVHDVDEFRGVHGCRGDIVVRHGGAVDEDEIDGGQGERLFEEDGLGGVHETVHDHAGDGPEQVAGEQEVVKVVSGFFAALEQGVGGRCEEPHEASVHLVDPLFSGECAQAGDRGVDQERVLDPFGFVHDDAAPLDVFGFFEEKLVLVPAADDEIVVVEGVDEFVDAMDVDDGPRVDLEGGAEFGEPRDGMARC